MLPAIPSVISDGLIEAALTVDTARRTPRREPVPVAAVMAPASALRSLRCEHRIRRGSFLGMSSEREPTTMRGWPLCRYDSIKKRHGFTAKVVAWNVEWATPRSRRSPEILARIFVDYDPDIVCLTEADFNLLADRSGSVTYSQPDGIRAKTDGSLRKVVLWSKEPWEKVDTQGVDTLPPGKFVSAVTTTPLGEVTVVGVCIPYRDARVRWTNDGVTRKPWEDHKQYLAGLNEVLRSMPASPLVLLGDFNQQVGQTGYAPRSLRGTLRAALPERITIATSALGFDGRRVIDQIAISEDLSAQSLSLISRYCSDKSLTDHVGVCADLGAQSAPALNPTENYAFERFTEPL